MSRTMIDLDDDLIRRARKLTGLKKKEDIVNKALEEFAQIPPKDMPMILKYHGILKKGRRKGVVKDESDRC